MSTDVRNRMWVEKYRPKTIDEVMIPEDYKDKFKEFIKTKDMPILLLSGPPGLGKTCIAKMLAELIAGEEDWMFMNASSETGIDNVRNKIQPFCRAQSFDSDIKVVVLDEVDGASTNFQNALKENIEKFYGTTRFIFTSNNPHNVEPAIRSRCQQFEFGEVDKKLLAKRLIEVLKTEKIEFDLDNLKSIIRGIGPDIRKCINELQKLSTNGKLVDFTSSDVKHKMIVELIKGTSFSAVRKYISEEGVNYDGLLKYMLNHANEISKDDWAGVMTDIGDIARDIKIGVDEDIAFSSGLVSIKERV